MLLNYKAVIFDLDGTILNTIDDLADSANEILRQLSCPVHETEKYKYFVGNGIPKLIERCLPADRQELKEEALRRFYEYYDRHSKDKTAPYEDIEETLNTLKENGIKLGVITNKADAIAKKIVPYYFGEGIFDYVRGLDETISAKPDPHGALEVADALCLKPHDVLYVGDSGVDMLTAVNAGFTPCGVLWGFRKADELSENGAKYIISSPSELIKLTGAKK